MTCKQSWTASRNLFPNGRILVLSCCAPCSGAVIEWLSVHFPTSCVLFYNPNIRPLSEYQKRLSENKKLCDFYHIEFVDLEYDNERWCALTNGLEDLPERSERCSICFQMRLRRAAEYAQKNDFSCVTSVLGVSKYKDFDQVNACAQKVFQDFDIPYIPVNWRKGGLEKRRLEIIKERQLYAQRYCGCRIF